MFPPVLVSTSLMIFSLIKFRSSSDRVLSSDCNETLIAMDFLSDGKFPPSKTSNIFTDLIFLSRFFDNFI